MEAASDPSGTAGEQGLVLTPARLRLSSGLVLAYTTSTWLPHAVFLALVLLKVG